MQRFVELATPLNAILNTDKTRIMTTCTASSLISRMAKSVNMSTMIIGKQLQTTIEQFSTKHVNGESQAVEVTDGLRILGTPIGSPTFCHQFLLDSLARARSDSSKLLRNLDDLQTILRIYSMCTANKITHLFGCDVFNTAVDELPSNYFLWDSDLTQEFNSMTEEVIGEITQEPSLPIYSQIIANLSIKQGGLGIQSPRLHAIPSYMSTSKRCLQYALQGVWLGFNRPRPTLPYSITSLYIDWETSNTRSWQIFRKYLPIFNSICGSDNGTSTDYVFETSLNASREKIKEFGSKKVKSTILLSPHITPPDVKSLLPVLLDKASSMALMTMSRLEGHDRMKNDTFITCLR